MNNEDYLKFYNLLLKLINYQNYPTSLELVKDLHSIDDIQYFVSKGFNGDRMKQAINRTLANLVDDGLVRANRTPVSFYGAIFSFDGLTTKGHNYLAVIEEPKAWRKIKNALHDEGIPLTPQSASRFMTKLFF